MYSQENKIPIIIKNKEIKINDGGDVYDHLDPNIIINKESLLNKEAVFYDYSDVRKFQKKFTPENGSKIMVYYKNQFYTLDSFDKIKDSGDHYFEIIKIPDSIKTIIYVKKSKKQSSPTK